MRKLFLSNNHNPSIKQKSKNKYEMSLMSTVMYGGRFVMENLEKTFTNLLFRSASVLGEQLTTCQMLLMQCAKYFI